MHRRDFRDLPLIIFSGIIAGMLVLSQLNIEEVLRIDRFQHFFVSAFLFLFLYFLLGQKSKGLVGAFVGTLAIGFFKEFTDPSFQGFDVVANFMGVSLGMMLMLTSQLLLQPNLKRLR